MKLRSLTYIAFCAVSCIGTIQAQAQTDDEKKLDQLNKLLESGLSSKKKLSFITPYLLDSLIGDYQKTLSGTPVESGKLIGTSLSITDKGATANIGISRIGSVYTQVTVAGQGKENFVSLFKDGQYGNTISTGLQAQIFLNSSGFFFKKEANMLHNRLLLLQTEKGAYKTGLPGNPNVTTAYDQKLTYLRSQIQLLNSGHNTYGRAETDITTLTDPQRKEVEDYATAADTLSKLGLLSEKFLKKKAADRLTEINTLLSQWTQTIGPDARRLRYYLSEAEAMQMKAPWNVLTFHWLTVGVNYNVTPYKIFDDTAVKADYANTENDYFVAVTVGYNHLRARQQGNQFRFFVAPAITFKNARVFDDEEKMTIERYKARVVGTDSLTIQDMSSEVYEKWNGRSFAASLEVPFVFYWNKKNIGFEVSPKVGVNDPKKDNVGLRLGIFIPTEIKEGVPMLVQPMFRLQKLFNGGDARFWKDNVVIGFNVSVTMPKGLGKIGK